MTTEQTNILTYFNILNRYKKIIFTFVIFSLIIATGISFLLPNWYYSYAVIKPSEDGGLNFFSAVLGSKGLSSIGKNLGVGSLQYSDLDYYQSLLSSRRISINLIEKFKLKKIYSQEYLFKTIDELKANSEFQSDSKSNLLIIGVYDKDPQRAKKMVDEYLFELESFVKEITDFNAKNNREFIEKRYIQNRKDLDTAEANMKSFQKKHGVIIPEEQFSGTIKAYAEIAAQKLFLESQISSIKAIQGENSPNLVGLYEQQKIIERQEKEFRVINEQKPQNEFYISLNRAPDLINSYIKLFREVEIQNKLLELVYPLYEQYKMEESKSVPAFIEIDKSFYPEYKVKPKRAIIVISSAIFSFLLICSFIFMYEYIIKIKKDNMS